MLFLGPQDSQRDLNLGRLRTVAKHSQLPYRRYTSNISFADFYTEKEEEKHKAEAHCWIRTLDASDLLSKL